MIIQLSGTHHPNAIMLAYLFTFLFSLEILLDDPFSFSPKKYYLQNMFAMMINALPN